MTCFLNSVTEVVLYCVIVKNCRPMTCFLNSVTEVACFVENNIQKLSENKYLCPLSGKKFKGPEFVKKHIFNKHMDKVEAVRQEVCVGKRLGGWMLE